MKLHPALVAFPLLVSIRLSLWVQVACLVVLLVLALVGRPRRGDELSRYLPLGLLGVAGALTLRGAPMFEVIALVAAVAVVVLAGRRCSTEVAVRSLMAGVSIFLWANLAGWVAGIESPGATVRVGLLEGRVLFPFVRSINEPSILAGALLGFVLIAWRKKMPVGRVAAAGVLAVPLVMWLSGSRFPLAVVAVLVPVVLLLPAVARLVPLLALGAMAVPFAYVALTPVIASIAQHVAGVGFLARGQSASELASGSERSTIWVDGLTFWGRVPDWSERLFGFGYNGHVESGVVFLYYNPGGFVNDPAALTLHSTLLQQMYDTGYVGLAALVAALGIIAWRWSRSGNLPASTMLGVIYTTAAIEVYLDPAFRSTPFLLVLALSVHAYNAKERPPSEEDGRSGRATKPHRSSQAAFKA